MSSKDSGKQYHKECTGALRSTGYSSLQQLFLSLRAASLGCFGVSSDSIPVLCVPRILAVIQVDGWLLDEVDPYKKPQELLELSPKGLVPALKLNSFNPPRALNESTVILEYLNDLALTVSGRTLLPPVTNPYARALVRLQSDLINRLLVPSFYRYLQAQDQEAQIKGGKEAEKELLNANIAGEGERKALSAGLGLWVEGNEDIGLADVMVGPWLHRAVVVLKHYRGFETPSGKKFNAWVDRLLEHPAFKATCSRDGCIWRAMKQAEVDQMKTYLEGEEVQLEKCVEDLGRLRNVVETLELEKLESEKHTLEKQIMERRSVLSVSRRLPIEIWNEIFSLVRFGNTDYSLSTRTHLGRFVGAESHAVPLRLSQVCSHWRSVVQVSPRLWASISFDIYGVNDPVVRLLETFLARSGNQPLRLRILDTRDPDYVGSESESDIMVGPGSPEVSIRAFRLLMAEMYRCEELQLRLGTWKVLNQLSEPPNFSFNSLRRLSINMMLAAAYPFEGQLDGFGEPFAHLRTLPISTSFTI
ncbi:hypothetical protein VNI00_014622 [Paramarasmius palmivorus]|uniref:GST C-terminal domain-containing protein n=1 Tax=Paramarasmius palmivorus TaxID=297713 RepID=A0AAW0BT29_9AGAR